MSTAINRRQFLQTSLCAAGLAGAQQRPPNIVLFLCDDLGYGDLGCYGSKIRTPNLDRLAAEGTRFTQFYSANPVCSPSRAALLTGRYPTRVGVPRVLFPKDEEGLDRSEQTLASLLKEKGYKTSCVGKWHLGHTANYLPTARGFDEYFGIPYSNDMTPRPLLRNTEVVEATATLETLTPRYTEQAVKFIERSKSDPFFLYMPHTYPHIPLAASDRFRGKSPLGIYGDVVEELDWSVGQVAGALKQHGLDRNTLVLFTSDNGPWYQGSAAPLRGRKGETYDGGSREPFIARWPGKIPANRICPGMATMYDILPTLANLCSAPLPSKPLDGIDVTSMLTGDADQIEHGLFLYFDLWQLQCARYGDWKLHISRYNSPPWIPPPPEGRLNLPLPKPELYDLDADPEEGYDVSSDNPDVVADILSRVNQALYDLPDQVRSAWQDTMRRKVGITEVGALPSTPSP